MLDERHDALPLDEDSRDTNNYLLGRVGKHNLVITCLPYGVTGTVSAARVVNQMLSTFRRIRFGLMIGIGGGAPSDEHDIRLGDVVVGSPKGLLGGVIQYDFGKTVQQGQFQRTGMLNKPPEVLLTALSNLQAKHFMEGHRIQTTIQHMMTSYPVMSFQYGRPPIETDRLFRSEYDHPQNQPTCLLCDVEQIIPRSNRHHDASRQPYIHYGLVASGDQVVKHGGLRDKLQRELGVLCFEMEAAGLVDSFPCLIIRGISDYADSHKNDVWQGYAAATAAAYAKELMDVISVGAPHNPSVVHGGQVGDGVGDMRFRVQEWLSPASSKDDLYRHQKDYMEGSCDWVLQKRPVASFLASNSESQILGIGGAPGIGKSTLTSFLIRRLMEEGNSRVFYFFCKDTSGDGGSRPHHAIRTLLSQVLVVEDSSQAVLQLEELRVQSGQKEVESLATLREAFIYTLATSPKTDKPAYFVIDGLDECEDGFLLASTIILILNDSKRPFRLLLASRQEPELVEFFQQYQRKSINLQLAPLHALTILPAHVRQPVVAYVRERVSQIQHLQTTTLGKDVLGGVSAAADGSWLYARLILDEIERLPSPASVARQLKDIPSGLVELYQTIFTTIGKSLTPTELYLAQYLFIWVDMKDFVRVGRRTLDREILDVVFQAANSGDEVFDSITLAQRLCAPLVTLKAVRGQASSSPKPNMKISLNHHTATQFIRRIASGTALTQTVPAVLKPQLLKALYRAKTAVWYFEQSEDLNHLLERLRNDPKESYNSIGIYFEMAYALWGAFYLQSLPENLDNDSQAQASILCNQLTDFLLSGRCLKWVELAIIINYHGGFTTLFHNVTTALRAALKSINSADENGVETPPSIPGFRTFSLARKQFFADYAYVISCTGPIDQEVMAVPDGFNSRPLAGALMELGKNWTHLYSIDPDDQF
ncbi:hypothetical protein BJY04DRAFT_218914 [Aspergillus karnatakaensis]|uniref:uncharacterized protein n=1 Tax=Aspergillus karnatakaensis TaxID=1810916 RepID=UPI003CCCA48B